MRFGLAILAVPALTGCQSFGRGVAEAGLEASGRSAEDTRACEVVGPPVHGLEPYLEAQDTLPPVGSEPGRRQLKILYIHGIGTHLPGHGSALADNLSRAMDRAVVAPRAKRIVIESPLGGGEDIGEINITRMVDRRRQRDVAFRDSVLPVFMLSNQLPLLEAGVAPQEVRAEAARFCQPDSPERAALLRPHRPRGDQRPERRDELSGAARMGRRLG